MSTQIINGVAVEVSGEGRPLLCIHGLGGTSNTWTPLMAGLTDFKIIRVDLPGSARSLLPTSEALSINSYVQTIQSLLDSMNIESVDVIAHSMGTIIASHLAVEYPLTVKSLALFGPLLSPPDQGRAGIRARASLARDSLNGMQEIADAIVAGATAQQTQDSQPAVLALVRESIMRQSQEGYAQSCEALAGAQSAAVEEIKIPVLLITGDQDVVAPPEAVNIFASRLTNVKVKVFEECGHWTTFEKPKACLQELHSFYQIHQ